MKSILVLGLITATFLEFGCSSPSANSSANSNSNTAASSNSANSSNVVPYTSATGTAVDANAANPENAANANQVQVKTVSPPANAKPMTFPAPDDSDYSTTMNSSGQAIETRTFHNDPLITKVERVWKDVNDKSVSIYLKSGKVVKVPSDKLTEIKSVPVQTLYDLAGAKPPQTVSKGSSTARKDEKPK